MRETGTLYLIPVPLGPGDPPAVLGSTVLSTLHALDCFIAESPKSARRFLKEAAYPRPLQTVRIATLNEHTSPDEIETLLGPIAAGEDCGLISEAGCPAVADPGAALVRRAHLRGIRVVPLPGPSAILLALMASGMNGQRFVFHGYLPVEPAERRRKLVALERAARDGDATQIFIETPYRNMAMLKAIVEACRDDTLLCVAADLTLPSETVLTQPVSKWRERPPEIGRRPAVFLLYRPT